MLTTDLNRARIRSVPSYDLNAEAQRKKVVHIVLSEGTESTEVLCEDAEREVLEGSAPSLQCRWHSLRPLLIIRINS